jgi:hypothetical protein
MQLLLEAKGNELEARTILLCGWHIKRTNAIVSLELYNGVIAFYGIRLQFQHV